jgi:hypothetical protein
MKRYVVKVQQVRVREVEVDAPNEQDAVKKAVAFVKKEGLINHKSPTFVATATYKGEV